MGSSQTEPFTIIGSQFAEGRPTEPQCPFQHRLEHRHKIARRGVDDAQYLGGGGLLLQGFARLGNQARVLHGDHGLRGEILHGRTSWRVTPKAPNRNPSFCNGTASRLRTPPRSTAARCKASPERYPAPSAISAICARDPPLRRRPMPVSGPASTGVRKNSSNAPGKPRDATERKCSPSETHSTPAAASHRVVAFLSIASNTGVRSPGDELMTPRTSAVAVCCSSASRRASSVAFLALMWAIEPVRRTAHPAAFPTPTAPSS